MSLNDDMKLLGLSRNGQFFGINVEGLHVGQTSNPS